MQLLFIALSTEQKLLITYGSLFLPYSIYFVDERVRQLALNNQNLQADRFLSFFNELGEGQYHILTFGGLYVLSKIIRNQSLEDFSSDGLKAFLLNGIIVVGLKILIGRARPYMNYGPYYFKPFNFGNDFNSLPSGHTIIAFSTASVISKKIHNPFIAGVSYGGASLVGMARIYKDQHYLSDVLVGTLIGGVLSFEISR
jgi:membrane-associated phospholipid phosphatase